MLKPTLGLSILFITQFSVSTALLLIFSFLTLFVLILPYKLRRHLIFSPHIPSLRFKRHCWFHNTTFSHPILHYLHYTCFYLHLFRCICLYSGAKIIHTHQLSAVVQHNPQQHTRTALCCKLRSTVLCRYRKMHYLQRVCWETWAKDCTNCDCRGTINTRTAEWVILTHFSFCSRFFLPKYWHTLSKFLDFS